MGSPRALACCRRRLADGRGVAHTTEYRQPQWHVSASAAGRGQVRSPRSCNTTGLGSPPIQIPNQNLNWRSSQLRFWMAIGPTLERRLAAIGVHGAVGFLLKTQAGESKIKAFTSGGASGLLVAAAILAAVSVASCPGDWRAISTRPADFAQWSGRQDARPQRHGWPRAVRNNFGMLGTREVAFMFMTT